MKYDKVPLCLLSVIKTQLQRIAAAESENRSLMQRIEAGEAANQSLARRVEAAEQSMRQIQISATRFDKQSQ